MDNTVNVASVIEPLKTALVGSITPAQLVAILAGIVGVGMTFVLMWFGARKLKQIFTQAVTKGKISF
ncbi:MAG: hypothetical protein ACLTXD_00205 [Clostridia bacterium]|jgi:hypothetical protein